MRKLDLDELRHWIAFERVEPFEDGWITSAKLIQIVAALAGEKAALGDVYPHLAPPAPDSRAVEARFQVWSYAHNAVVARAEETRAAADRARAAAEAKMKAISDATYQ